MLLEVLHTRQPFSTKSYISSGAKVEKSLLCADQIFDFRRLHDRSNGKTNKSKYIHSKGCVFMGSKEANYGKKEQIKRSYKCKSQNMESFTFVPKQKRFAFETSRTPFNFPLHP